MHCLTRQTDGTAFELQLEVFFGQHFQGEARSLLVALGITCNTSINQDRSSHMLS